MNMLLLDLAERIFLFLQVPCAPIRRAFGWPLIICAESNFICTVVVAEFMQLSLFSTQMWTVESEKIGAV
jgi:hypothetical protein